MLARADTYLAESTFALVDANRDGNISLSEWKQFISAAASAFPATTAVCFKRSRLKVFGALDRSRDGRVSWREWQAAGARHYEPDMPDCL
jgi:hypothetical protein